MSIAVSILSIRCIASAGEIKNFILDKSRVYDIKIAANATGTTTIMFPSEIGSIQGANVTTKAGENAGFVITANKNSYFFSLQAQKPDAVGSLNIVYDHKIFVLKLFTVPEKNAYSSVTFQNTDDVYNKNDSTSTSVTPTFIRDLIEKARLYFVLQKQYPDYYENVEIADINQTFQYTGYSIKLENVFRFKSSDTNVFQIVLKNKTDDTLVFDPHLIAVRLNSQLFYSSVTVASGKIPPNGESPIWFAITGSSDGTQNNMAAKNNWQVLLTASKQNQNKSTLDVNTEIIQEQQSLKKEITEINNQLNSNDLSDIQINHLSKQIDELNKKLSAIESYNKI